MPLPSGEGTSETLVLCVSLLRTVAMTPLQDQPPKQDQHAQKYGMVHGECAGLVWQIWLYWSQVSVTMKQTLKLIS